MPIRKECKKCNQITRSNRALCRNCQKKDRICTVCETKCVYAHTELKLCQKCNSRRHYKLNSDIIKEKTSKYHKEKVRKRLGLPLDHPRLTAKSGSGTVCKRSGYRYITKPGHPNSWNTKHHKGRILEHTWVMSEHLGRALKKNESVHHLNGIRNDNRIENLELWHRRQPPGQRLEDKLKWAKQFLEEYGYKVEKE